MRRLFEAWKRALDATIEVPDREPAINALSSCRRKTAHAIEREREREDRGGRIEKREAEIFGGCEDYRGKGWLCLPVKAPAGEGRRDERQRWYPRRIRFKGTRLAYIQLESRIPISTMEPNT